MKCLSVVILALVVIAAESKVLPASNVESQQTETQPLQLSDQIREAQNQIASLGAQLQDLLHLPNQEEIANTIKEQSSNLANSIQSFMKNVTDEIKTKTPELENLWENVKTKLADIPSNLNVNPETTEQVNQLQAKFQEGLQTLVNESENVAKALNKNSEKMQDSISKFTKQALDIVAQASQNFNNQLQQSSSTAQP
ncbi:uncharacterized protein LOC109858813 [Pseudomyrmex gracilis]|uniref:uncharacterized protein LOC109858813 n=1 Tax=Pseudomyrmex gracilis TaxID=219809 RepID=UPI000994ACBB|nr:uncharacterized protein LOC109858813 [Pseudomyrmex gracilis]